MNLSTSRPDIQRDPLMLHDGSAQADHPLPMDRNDGGLPAFPDNPFRSILALVGNHKLLILLTACCVVFAAAVLVKLIPPTYSASAEVIYDQSKNRIPAQSSNSEPYLPTDPAVVQNQIRILTSTVLAQRVIEKLQLKNDPEFNPTHSGAGSVASNMPEDQASSHPNQVVEAFLSHLDVHVVGLSTALEIKFTSHNPETAAAVTNAIVSEYIENQVASKSESTRAAISWLKKSADDLAADTQKAEAEVQAYKRSTGIIDVAGGTSLIGQQLVALEAQLMQAKAKLVNDRAMEQRVQILSSTGASLDASEVALSPLIAQLRQQEADVTRQQAEMSTRYGPKNPKTIALQSEHKSLDAKIGAELTRVSAGLANETAEASAEVESTEQSIAAVQKEVSSENLARVPLGSLEANAQSARQAYQTTASRLREMQGLGAMQVPDATVISWAQVPTIPNAPKQSLMIIAAIPAGLLFGLLAAVIRQWGSSSVGSFGKASAKSLVRGRIPIPVSRNDVHANAFDAVLQSPRSAFATSIAALERTLAKPGGKRVIGFMGPRQGENKALISASLARTAAKRGLRAVLVDCDPNSDIWLHLGLQPKRTTIFEVLAGKARPDECAAVDRSSGALVLSSGNPPRDALQALASPQMEQLIDEISRVSDLVIINYPPTWSESELRKAAKRIDELLLVLAYDPALAVGREQFKAAPMDWKFDNLGLVLAG